MKKVLKKEIKIIIDVDVTMEVVVEVAKAIEEEIFSVHQIMKKKCKTHISQRGCGRWHNSR